MVGPLPYVVFVVGISFVEYEDCMFAKVGLIGAIAVGMV